MTNNDRFQYLLDKYLSGNISNQEHDEFFELLASNKYDALINRSVQQELLEHSPVTIADLPPHIAQEIVRNIFHAEKDTAQILPIKRIPVWRWAVAACLILATAAAFFISMNNRNKTTEQFALLIPSATVSKENLTDIPQPVTLSDGSVITLKPRSIIHYPANFDGVTREVYLEGEAFFQVTKNPGKPFLVYYNNIVTKVLGTSFTVVTNANTGNIEVSVKTGRVQVYENEKLVKGNTSAGSVIVTPNQKAIYQVEKRVLEASLIDKPEPVKINVDSANNKMERFIYDQERLSVIFGQLEKAYGIELVEENSNLNDCVFTGDVSNQGLFTQLKIICLATNSTYEISGTKILIKGTGCNKQ